MSPALNLQGVSARPNSKEKVDFRCSECQCVYQRQYIEIIRSFNRQSRYTDKLLCNSCLKQVPSYIESIRTSSLLGAKKYSFENRSENSKKNWEREEYRLQAVERGSLLKNDQAFKSKISETLKNKFKTDEDYKLKIQEARKEYWNKRSYREDRHISTEEFLENANKIHDGVYDYSKVEIIDMRSKVEIICANHGSFLQRPSHHVHYKNGCPKCTFEASSSNAESEIAKFIGDNYEGAVDVNVRDVLPFNYELDIYVPDAKFAVEYHGLYWHSYGRMESTSEKYKNQRKADFACTQGLNLIQVYDYEWCNKRSIVESMIMHRLGRSRKISARNCSILEVDDKTASEFFKNNHIQGKKPADVYYGLFLNDKLMSCISLDKGWEISRFATLLNHVVVGGLSRLLKYFVKRQDPKYIFTYTDRRFSANAGSYQAAGFMLVSKTKPNYRYMRGNKNFNRQSFQKHKLKKLLENFDPELTEAQNMFNNGYRRYWDAGHFKLEWSKCIK